jgi:hypothetical protein
LWAARWQRFSAASLKAFHAYAGWLVSISWRRFFALSALLIIVMAIIHDQPPLTWRVSENTVEPSGPRVIVMPPAPPLPPAPSGGGSRPAPADAPIQIQTPPGKDGKGGVEITIGKDGVRIRRGAAPAGDAASAAGPAEDGAAHAAGDDGAIKEDLQRAIGEAKREIEAAVREATRDAEQARKDAEEAQQQAEQVRRDARAAIEELTGRGGKSRGSRTTRRVGIGDLLMQLTLLWVAASAAIKITYKGRMQAEVKAAQATETAEAESLKRQVVEARMAAMQAQVEPHFLFNTLARIDHLIETDPARASQMQKNLIALLRASMPTMREANAAGSSGPRDLGREIAVIRPYLEILKVRMEERLVTDIAVPDGLLSAEFPAMMIQTLVENAIKHGLEPKPEGGRLRVAAEIVHGKLQVTVADTGLGFGKAPTAGTGVGLANIRERLQLLYGPRATLTVAGNQPSGTVVTVTVPYKTVAGMGE